MAWDTSVIDRGVRGSQRYYVYSVTADAATHTFKTPLGWIIEHQLSPQSLSTAGVTIGANSGATGTAIAGQLGCSGFASGDVFFLTVYGN